MLIKFEATDKFASQLKQLTGATVASKAFFFAAQQFVTLHSRVAQLEQQLTAQRTQSEKQIAKLQAKCDEKQAVIKAASVAAKTLLSKVEPAKRPSSTVTRGLIK